jgi:hypothetical protein
MDLGGWVCLGKYGSANERLVQQREMLITKSGYDSGVLFDLVQFSLQIQAEADREAKVDAAAKTKGAETKAEADAKNKVQADAKALRGAPLLPP